jgi:hypothetical protein
MQKEYGWAVTAQIVKDAMCHGPDVKEEECTQRHLSSSGIQWLGGRKWKTHERNSEMCKRRTRAFKGDRDLRGSARQGSLSHMHSPRLREHSREDKEVWKKATRLLRASRSKDDERVSGTITKHYLGKGTYASTPSRFRRGKRGSG